MQGDRAWGGQDRAGRPLADAGGRAAATLARLFGHDHAPGRLLLRDIDAAGTRGACPRGWVAVDARGGTATRADANNAAAAPSAAGLEPASGAPSSALVPAPKPSAFEGVPVPTVYIGLLPAPIPAGRPTLSADSLLSSLQSGVLPSDSLPEADRGVWRAASRITDPISAYNICQAQALAGRKLILTERGVAEQLARGTIQARPRPQPRPAAHRPRAGPRARARPTCAPPAADTPPQMVPAEAGGSGSGARQGGGLAALNPVAALRRLGARLADGRALSRGVRRRADDLGGGAPPRQQQPARHGAAPAGEDGAGGPGGPPAQPAPQYSLQDRPERRLLASGSPPQLAWVPLRVALHLLRSLPQHFMVLQGPGAPAAAAAQPDGKRQRRQQRQQQQPGRLGAGGAFCTAASPAALQVHVIPGLHVRQVAADGSAVEFVPAFLCADQVQALWRDLREVGGGAMLAYRRLQRAVMRRRLEAAAALIAGGGRGGAPAAGGAQADDEGSAPEEPPEVAEFIRELGGGGAPGAPTGAPPSGLSRLAATFACGVVSLAAQGLSWAGNTADWLMMATPMGPHLLGVPQAAVQRCSLGELAGGLARYNADHAELEAALRGALVRLRAAQAGGGGAPDAPGDEAAAAAYARRLAAGALWLALGGKSLAEDGAGGVPFSRLLARAVLQQAGQAAAAAVAGDLPAAGAAADASALVPPGEAAAAAEADVREAVERVLAQGLPLLEHNGFAQLLGGGEAQPPPDAGAGAGAAVARAVAPHCTGAIQVGLGAFVRDSEAGGFSVADAPLGPPPSGRGLILVGDLDLRPRQRGAAASGRTPAAWLTVGVDDARKLL